MNIQIVGITGAAVVLIAFAMNQLQYWKNSDIKYDVANFAGGVLLSVYAILINSLPFAILNFIWMAVSLRDVVNNFKKRAWQGKYE